MNRPAVYLACGFLSWTCAQPAAAQDVEPRIFSPAPVGMNIAGLSLLHSWGAVVLDKAFPVDDLARGLTAKLIGSLGFWAEAGTNFRTLALQWAYVW